MWWEEGDGTEKYNSTSWYRQINYIFSMGSYFQYLDDYANILLDRGGDYAGLNTQEVIKFAQTDEVIGILFLCIETIFPSCIYKLMTKDRHTDGQGDTCRD